MTDPDTLTYDAPIDAEVIEAEVVPEPEQPPAQTPALYVPPVQSVVPAKAELEALAQLATTLAAADAVPYALKNKPNDVFLVLLSARDLGTSLTTALREFHVIQGRVTLSPKVKLAMVNERGRAEGWAVWPDPDNDAGTATWYATRTDRPAVTFRSTFHWEDAQRAGMVRWDCEATEHCEKCKADWGKRDGKACKDNYRTHPARMQSWRALGYLLDDAFPEVGTGLYDADALGAVTDADGNPVIDVTEVEPYAGHAAPRGRRKKASADDPPPLLSDEDREALAVRIAAIKTVPEAAAALTDEWTRKGEDDQPRLPALPKLLARQVVVAKALVSAIEARLRKDEWGTWDADPTKAPESPEPAPVPPSGPPPAGGGQPVPEAQSEPQSLLDVPAEVIEDVGRAHPALAGGESTPFSDDLQLAQAVRDEVNAMPISEVQAALRKAEIRPNGSPTADRKTLADLLYRQRGGNGSEYGLNATQQAAMASTPAARLASAHLVVSDLTDEDVLAELEARGLDTDGDATGQRVRLAMSMADD